ncbi:Uncharacterized protein KIAA0319 [Cricetulus griseus]|uniref:Uncharacterized protein KIAA0319 n=1 Tax=Cricetulus griseus TaxID=10029 RepID=G3HDW3_CRIGR|nr:Uncharacterized protein KIAA0319 [Cricetulus griseus]
MGDPNSRKKQALNRLRAQLRKKKESLADQFDFKMYIAFVFKEKKKKSALFEVSEVIPVMTNNYEENILKGVRDSSYSLESSIELLQKDVVQLHAPRYQSMRRAKFEFHHGDYEKQFLHVLSRKDKTGIVVNNPNQSVFLFIDRQHLQFEESKVYQVPEADNLWLYSPDVVFLQEVIPSYCAYLKKRASSYKIITGNEEGYFTAILLKKGKAKFKSQEIVPFPNTKMMRNLLCVNASVGGNEFCLMTSHLESTREHSAERISQLKMVFQKMQEAPDSTTVIFAGDTNLRDHEPGVQPSHGGEKLHSYSHSTKHRTQHLNICHQYSSPWADPTCVACVTYYFFKDRVILESISILVSDLFPDSTYSYEWSLMSHPVDFQGKITQENKPILHLSQLSVGLYTFRVTVSSENAFGEGYVNVTVMPAARVNQPPVAVVSPQIQELTVPLTSALIDGSRVLTITDSDGATNSTMATLIIHGAVDYPPVANAGPNQTITLPQNTITLNGNQSSDDHQIVLYEWSPGPGGESKEMVMQATQTPYLHLSEMQEGEYMFQLMVTDSSGQQSTAMVAVIVQAENNQAPVAVAGPDKELFFPVQSATLDGSRSSDDHGIVCYHWEPIRGPSAVEMENVDKAIATVTGLQVGTYHFRLTVRDQQGLSSTSTLTVAVKKKDNSPPRAQAGGRHVLTLPNNSITLDGSQSTDDGGIVSYLWIRDGQSPAAGDVIGGSDNGVALQLTNLVEGVYTFHLLVTDSQGASDSDTAIVEVLPDPKKDGLVELILQVGVEQLTEQQKETLVRQLAILLNVLDSDVKVLKVQAHTDVSTVIIFYVQSGPPFKVLRAADVARNLHRRLSKEKAAFLLFKVLRIDTAGCLLKCSGHGHCDPITKRCICSQLWMENLIQSYMWDGESNCEWSVFYVAALALTLTVLTGAVTWLCICCCRRRKRTKIRKKTKYTILDNMDEQERMELRPKYGIKHRSTEHNSSLMVSESEFESDQDTLFSRERMERGILKGSLNGSARNGDSFSYCAKDR